MWLLLACAGDGDDAGLLPGPDCTDDPWPVDTPANVLGAHVVAGTARGALLDDLHGMAEAVRPLDGPWQHYVAGPYRAGNGIEFGPAGATELPQASVPDAISEGGRWWLFFVDGDLDAMLSSADAGTPLEAGWTGVAGLGAASSDDGATFSREELTFSGELPLLMADPDVIALPGGGWRMYYLGSTAAQACADTLDPAGTPGAHVIWAAESDDLTHWTQLGPAYTSEEGGSDPSVWCLEDGSCHMLLHDRGVPVVAARSDDGGLSFIPDTLDLPDTFLAMPDVVDTPNGWRMYAQAAEGELFVLSSTDGLVWTDAGLLGISGTAPAAAEHDPDVWLWVGGSSAR